MILGPVEEPRGAVNCEFQHMLQNHGLLLSQLNGHLSAVEETETDRHISVPPDQ